MPTMVRAKYALDRVLRHIRVASKEGLKDRLIAATRQSPFMVLNSRARLGVEMACRGARPRTTPQ